MDMLDHRSKGIRIRVGLNPVSEIEDVSRMPCVVVEHLVGGSKCGVDIAEYGGRIHVALHDEVIAESASRIADGRPPIEADDVASRLVDRVEQMITSDSEVNSSDMRESVVQHIEHVLRMGKDERAVFALGEGPSPRIEQLECRRPMFDLVRN